MEIAVVILNWNGKKLLEKFLPSVIQHSQNASIYLADNASTDNSVSYVKTAFPLVKIIQNSENGGYAKGYNDALKNIDADIFCLLNNDIEVTRNWLTPIIKTFQEEQNVAIVQPKLLDYKSRNYFEYAGAAGGFIDKYGYPYCRGRIFNTLEKDQNQYNKNAEIFWSSGACLFIRKKVFNKLHGLDEAFFAHMEEMDMCWRAKNLGYNIKYVGNSTVYHVGGATLKNSNPKKTYLNFRNSLFAIVKNAKGNVLFLIVIRLILDGFAGVYFLFKLKINHFFAIIKAHLSFYNHLTTLLKQRKTLSQDVKYYSISSIVWAYFINKKKYYKNL